MRIIPIDSHLGAGDNTDLQIAAQTVYMGPAANKTETMDMVKISTLKPGDKGVIARISKDSPRYRQTLLTMGLVPGTPFTFIRSAPLGDPVQISVRGVSLALRQQEANCIEVTKDES